MIRLSTPNRSRLSSACVPRFTSPIAVISGRRRLLRTGGRLDIEIRRGDDTLASLRSVEPPDLGAVSNRRASSAGHAHVAAGRGVAAGAFDQEVVALGLAQDRGADSRF